MSTPVVMAYGMGTNSVAMLVGLLERGEKVDLILSADTGGERESTYQHRDFMSDWCVSNGFPAIESVRKGGRQETLEENCLRMNMLPSIAYGFKSCSQKYKRVPQDTYCNNWAPARAAWDAGERVQASSNLQRRAFCQLQTHCTRGRAGGAKTALRPSLAQASRNQARALASSVQAAHGMKSKRSRQSTRFCFIALWSWSEMPKPISTQLLALGGAFHGMSMPMERTQPGLQRVEHHAMPLAAR